MAPSDATTASDTGETRYCAMVGLLLSYIIRCTVDNHSWEYAANIRRKCIGALNCDDGGEGR